MLVISVPVKYHEAGDKISKKHQLFVEFEDESSITCTVQLWGAMFCVNANDMPGRPPTPLEDKFNEDYFINLFDKTDKNISVKAFLTTDQRIVGFGNGVLHDVLFNAKLHPKRKLDTLSEKDVEYLYKSIKSTLYEMDKQGGRDTEKNLFNKPGGYTTILSSKTKNHPCPVCGEKIVREAYLGGNIYYCPICQKY